MGQSMIAIGTVWAKVCQVVKQKRDGPQTCNWEALLAYHAHTFLNHSLAIKGGLLREGPLDLPHSV